MSHPLDFYVKKPVVSTEPTYLLGGPPDPPIPDRSGVIDKIVKASHRSVPPIVEAKRAKNKKTGKLYSIFGMPFDFKIEDYEIVTVGYVFSDVRNNTTYGTVTQTAEELAVKFAENQDKIGEEFRDLLGEMTDERLAEQAEYWLGKKGD